MTHKRIYVVTDTFQRYQVFIEKNSLDTETWKFCSMPEPLFGRENYDLIFIEGYLNIDPKNLQRIKDQYATGGKRCFPAVRGQNLTGLSNTFDILIVEFSRHPDVNKQLADQGRREIRKAFETLERSYHP